MKSLKAKADVSLALCQSSDEGLKLERQPLTSLQWPTINSIDDTTINSIDDTTINSIDDTKLPCCTLPPMQHHIFFRNLIPLFIQLEHTLREE